MEDPDVISRIDSDTNDRADDPMIGEGLGPHGVDFKTWGLGGGGLNLRTLPVGDEGEGGDDAEE